MQRYNDTPRYGDPWSPGRNRHEKAASFIADVDTALAALQRGQGGSNQSGSRL